MQQLFTANRSGPVNEGLPSIRLELSTRNHSHTALIIGIAGLALIPALTFLTAASGMTLFGVSGAFWGLVLGGLVWLSKSLLNRQPLASSKPDDDRA